VAAVLLLFVTEKPLATTIERDISPEPLATGSLSIVAPAGAPTAVTDVHGVAGRGEPR
jgi:hypothetical protein